MSEEPEVSLAALLAELDWIKILDYAVNKSVFHSAWHKNPIVEWRNAGDSIYTATLQALRDVGIDAYKTKVHVEKEKNLKRV